MTTWNIIKNKEFVASLKRMQLHFLFWGFAFYILLHIFSGSSKFQKIDYLYTLVFLTSLEIPCYVSNYIILPRFLKHNQIKLVLFSCGNILLFAFVNHILFNHFIDFILPGYYFISYYSFVDLLKFFSAFVIIAALIKFAKAWYNSIEKQKKIEQLEKEKLKSELKALMNQVNPHFLFNSLTVLYSLAIEKSNKTPDAIIKLSDILRYVIHDSNKAFVNINSEIKLINNYIDLQRFRTPNTANIEIKLNITNKHSKIAPMLLLPLVENSFKHGVNGSLKSPFVIISIASNSTEFTFSIINNKGEIDDVLPNHSGIGINNIKSRLELIYPTMHNFSIIELENSFEVNLTIKL